MTAAWVPYELGQRRHHDGIAVLLPHAPGFLQGLVDPVAHAYGLELVVQVGDHAAGHLVQVLGVVVLPRRAHGEILLPGHSGEVLLHGLDRLQVHPWRQPHGLGVGRDVVDGGLGRAVGQGRYGRVERLDSQLEGLHVVQRRQAVVAVGVELQRDVADVGHHQLEHLPGAVRRQQPADVLEADPVGPVAPPARGPSARSTRWCAWEKPSR